MMLNSRQAGMRFANRGEGLLGIAAEAEARRRILIAAIALERHRGRHGGYPKALQELVPELLQTPPVDFMDGKPLRYQLTDDGHFVLYSVGLDCVDDGGNDRWRWRKDPNGPPAMTLQQHSIWSGRARLPRLRFKPSRRRMKSKPSWNGQP
jgi:hypothetical protein